MKRSESTRLETFQEIIEHRRRKENSSEGSANNTNDGLGKLHDDLWLASSVGQALLEENSDYKERLTVSEAARDTLLDRLAASYRDNAAVERRLERLQANLDSSESANRALLSTLEEDRKTINRLSSEAARASGYDKKIRALTRERDDLRQELEMQIRKATAAENRARRATDKLGQGDGKSTPQIGQSPLMPEQPSFAPMLGSPVKVLAKRAKLRHSDSAIFRNVSAATAATEPVELLDLVKTLVDQNADLKMEMEQAHEMLDAAREDQQILRAELDQRSIGADNDHQMGARSSFLSEMMLKRRSPSPAFGHNPASPTLVNSPGLPGFPYSPHEAPLQSTLSASTSSSMASADKDTGSESSAGLFKSPMTYGLGGSSRRKRLGPRPLSLASTPKVSASSRRPRSADMTNLYCQVDSADAPGIASPALDTIIDTSPIIQRKSTATFTSSGYNGESQIPSAPGSPTAMRQQRDMALDSLTRGSPYIMRQMCDAGVQTESQSATLQPAFAMKKRIDVLRAESTQSGTNSDFYGENADEFCRSETSTPDNKSHETRDNKTAALFTLIDHSARLLSRLKTADVASLEARLKKQNLPGDVSLLARNTVRDLLAEIESLRDIFRKVIEQERHTGHDSNPSGQSLVARRDFVSLVKLLRDILSELGRLRSIVNRVQIEPSLAYKMAELDAAPAYDDSVQSSSGARSLLAPFSRFFSPLAGVDHKSRPTTKEGLPVPKVTASKAVAADTVNVEFASGAVKQAVMHDVTGSAQLANQRRPELSNTLKRKTTQAALNGIFAGGRSTQRADWLTVSAARTAAPSSRQYATGGSRTFMSPTTDAVIDTFSGPVDDNQPNLLERTLRPRGLSDSSIRSTYIAQANPMRIPPVKPAPATSLISDAELEASLMSAPTTTKSPLARAIGVSPSVAMRPTPPSSYFAVSALPFSYVGSFAESSRIRQQQ